MIGKSCTASTSRCPIQSLLRNFPPKALCGTAGGTCSARFFRPVMNVYMGDMLFSPSPTLDFNFSITTAKVSVEDLSNHTYPTNTSEFKR